MSYLRDRLSPPLESVGEVEPIEPWRKALLDAAELIRVRGHWKGSAVGPGGQVCLRGAVRIACGRNEDRTYAAWGPLVKYLGGADGNRPIQWNDAPERTAAEVIAALESCARS